jgi:sigma-B regulation protein RsbU (phosphoserine phosphatase)
MKEQLQGVLVMSLAERDFAMGPAQARVLRALGHQVNVCVQLHLLTTRLQGSEALERELELARHIQRSLLPQHIPKHEHYDLFAGCIMAAHVGGDYYDFHEQEGKLGMVIADASGHSISSALIAMSFRSAFWHSMDLGLSLEGLFGRVNKSLACELADSDHFLSAFHCMYAPDRRNLCYVNAGHNRPFIYRASNGEFIELQEAGFLMGVMEDASYPVGEANLERDDIVVLYTDGIVEAHSERGEMFGLKRLRDAVRKHSSRSTKGLYHSILKEVYIFQDDRCNKDDITLMLMKAR